MTEVRIQGSVIKILPSHFWTRSKIYSNCFVQTEYQKIYLIVAFWEKEVWKINRKKLKPEEDSKRDLDKSRKDNDILKEGHSRIIFVQKLGKK